MRTYDYYHRRLAGDETALPSLNILEPGFYRNRREPVAIFYEPEDEPVAGIPTAEVQMRLVRGREDRKRVLRGDDVEALELWPWIAFNPVPELEWRNVYAGGEWDDEAPGLGHNRPPEDLDPVAKRAKVVDLAEQWLGKLPAGQVVDDKPFPQVRTKVQADQAAHYVTELRNLVGDLEKEEKATKKPFNDALDMVRAAYRGWRAPLEATAAKLKQALKPYLDDIDAKNEAARKAAQAAKDAAVAAGADRMPRESIAPTTRVGGHGHAVTLKSYWSAEIVDYLAALEAAGLEPEVKDAVQVVANRFARASKGKDCLPGTRPKEDRR